MSMFLYRAFSFLGAPAIGFYLNRRKAAGKEDSDRFAERMGRASKPRPDGAVIWIHAASVGESLSMLALIERLRVERPELNLLMTTGTVTSARIMEDRLPDGVTHQYVPVDRTRWVRRFFEHWQPDMVLWVESEFWPNMLSEIGWRDIPSILINARISPGSYSGWRYAPRIIRRLLANFDLCFAQSETDRDKLLALGATDVRSCGNLKFAAAPLPADKTELARMRGVLNGRRCWLAASTHPGEEAMIAAAHRALRRDYDDLLTIIVPRHPGRGTEIAAELINAGLVIARRAADDAIVPGTEIYVADSMGELGLFLRLSDVVFMGGSLVPHGGQNLLEAAKTDCAIVYGPHMENFSAIVREMTDEEATAVVHDGNELASEIGRLLGDSVLRMERTRAAARVAAAKTDILDRVLAELRPHLDKLSEKSPGLDHNAPQAPPDYHARA